MRSADAIRRILWAPGELGLSRAYVAGNIDVEGDIYEVLHALQDAAARDLRDMGIEDAGTPRKSRCVSSNATSPTSCGAT